MAQVDHLTAGRLDDSSHDIDRCIVPVKKGGRCNDSNVILGFVYLYFLSHVASKFWVNKFTENEGELVGFGLSKDS